MTVGDRYPLTIFGRLLRCKSCGCDVDLIELPQPWIDGDTYVCGECLKPVEINIARLPEPPAPPKQRWSDYDPRTSPWPAGF